MQFSTRIWDMAVVWTSWYLSFGLVLISSNGGFSTISNPSTRKGDRFTDHTDHSNHSLHILSTETSVTKHLATVTFSRSGLSIERAVPRTNNEKINFNETHSSLSPVASSSSTRALKEKSTTIATKIMKKFLNYSAVPQKDRTEMTESAQSYQFVATSPTAYFTSKLITDTLSLLPKNNTFESSSNAPKTYNSSASRRSTENFAIQYVSNESLGTARPSRGVMTTTSTMKIDDSVDYLADVYDVFTDDYVTAATQNKSRPESNTTSEIDISSLRDKFNRTFANFTSSFFKEIPSRTTASAFKNDAAAEREISAGRAATISNIETHYSSTDNPFTSTSTIYPTLNVTSSFNVSANDRSSSDKEQLQLPGITLKVSHVLIPKQKRSRYNIRTMRIELPKGELSANKSSTNATKFSKNSNCTRFPVHVVTASDSDSSVMVNLTEERYDCEFSSEIRGPTPLKQKVDSIRTYFGGYVFRYTIPKSSSSLVTTNQSSTGITKAVADTTTSITTTTADENDDYFSEYSDLANNGNGSGPTDDAVFPDPVIQDEKTLMAKTEAYSVPPADANQIDNELHDHDVMDSVMYIYFGGASREQRGAGRQIIIVGAVIALVAQFLTLASGVRRIKTHRGEASTIILLNVEIALTLTNLIFILGVQSTSSHTWCNVTTVSLYYLHIATLLWFLLSSIHSVQIVCQIKKPAKFRVFCICGWTLPFFTTLLSYYFNQRSFETNSYCWISPLRGILFSYIIPVIFSSMICIVSTVCGLKRSADALDEMEDSYNHRKLLRISAIALPLFSVIWFTGMVALENSSSLLFSMIFLISSTILNWLLFACWLPSEASQWKDMDDDYYDEEEDFDDEAILAKRRFDDQPLLSELYEYGAHGQLYNLKVEPISIISAP